MLDWPRPQHATQRGPDIQRSCFRACSLISVRGFGDPSHGGHPRDIRIQQLQNDGKGTSEEPSSKMCFGAAIVSGWPLRLTENGYTELHPGPAGGAVGDILGSKIWFPISTSTKKLTGKLTGLAVRGTACRCNVSRFGQMTQFRNDADVHLADCRNCLPARPSSNLSLSRTPPGGLWLGWSTPRRRRWEQTWTVSSRGGRPTDRGVQNTSLFRAAMMKLYSVISEASPW